MGLPVSTAFSASHSSLQSAWHGSTTLHARCHTCSTAQHADPALTRPAVRALPAQLLGPVASLAFLTVSAQASLSILQWRILFCTYCHEFAHEDFSAVVTNQRRRLQGTVAQHLPYKPARVIQGFPSSLHTISSLASNDLPRDTIIANQPYSTRTVSERQSTVFRNFWTTSYSLKRRSSTTGDSRHINRALKSGFWAVRSRYMQYNSCRLPHVSRRWAQQFASRTVVSRHHIGLFLARSMSRNKIMPGRGNTKREQWLSAATTLRTTRFGLPAVLGTPKPR